MGRWGTLEPLREREFRLLFLGQSVSVLGDAISGIALAFAVLAIGGSASDLGLVLAAGAVPFLGFLLVGGVVADRLPRRAVMLAADLVRFAAQGVAAVLLISGHAEVWALAALNGVRGAAGAFFGPASTGLVPQTISAERLQQANALRGMTASGAWIVGPALGGALVAGAGSGWAVAADAVSYAISAGFLSRLAVSRTEPLPPQRFLGDLRDGWQAFTERSWVWVTVTSLTVVNVFSTAFFVLGPVVAERSLGGASAWAVILSAGSVGALLGALLVYRLKPERPLLVACLSVALGAVPSALLALPAATALIAAATLIAGGGVLVFNALWETTLQQHVPAEALSRVSAYDYLGSGIANPLGLAIFGPIAATIGIHRTLLLAAACEFAALMFMLSRRSVREVRARAVTV